MEADVEVREAKFVIVRGEYDNKFYLMNLHTRKAEPIKPSEMLALADSIDEWFQAILDKDEIGR